MSVNGRLLSNIQRDIIHQYRTLLRLSRDKDQSIRAAIINEFHENATSVQRKNSLKIEYLIRRGEKHIELLKTAGMTRRRQVNPNASDGSISQSRAGSVRHVLINSHNNAVEQ